MHKTGAKVLVITLAVLAAIGIGDAVVAHKAGNRFHDAMMALDGAPLGSSLLSVTNVHVDQGLFSSKATADLQLAVPGSSAIAIPIVVHAAQGMSLDGSVLRLHAQLGPQSDPDIQNLLKTLHDPNPIDIGAKFGPSGNLKHISLNVSPVHTTIAAQHGPIHVDFGGAQSDEDVDGFFSSQGGSLRIRYRQMPISVQMTNPALKIAVGPMDETLQEDGNLNNAHGNFRVQGNQLDVSSNQPNQSFSFDKLVMSSDFAFRGLNDESANNPSGLPKGAFSLSGMHFDAHMAQPMSGSMKLGGDLRFVADPQIPNMLANLDIPAFVGAVLNGLQMQMHAQIDRSLLAKLPAQQLSELEREGIMRADGEHEVVDAALKNGDLQINGQTVPLSR